MNPSLQKTLNKTFLQLIDDLKDKKEIFFRDFLGEKEYEDLVKKLAVIYWIRKNRPVDIIRENLKVSSAEIASAKKLMNKDGIKLAIKYLEAEEFANVWAEKIKSVVK